MVDLADVVVWVSVVILFFLFCFQRFGTDKVGYTFAPCICIWFICIALIGVYNIAKWDPSVFKAFNPYYIYLFFKNNKMNGWISLGGIVLAITGICSFWPELVIENLKPSQLVKQIGREEVLPSIEREPRVFSEQCCGFEVNARLSCTLRTTSLKIEKNPILLVFVLPNISHRCYSLECIQGTEAMFADLGHFAVSSIQVGTGSQILYTGMHQFA